MAEAARGKAQREFSLMYEVGMLEKWMEEELEVRGRKAAAAGRAVAGALNEK
jgi:hypothetical protein